jgi:hypothetical protein
MSAMQPRDFGGRPPEGVFLGADTGPSWVLFSGTLLALLAMMNFIYGIAAVSDSKFFVGEAQFVLGNLHTWGWVLIVVSIVQIVAAVGVWAQMAGMRWLGVGIAAVNAIVQMITIPAYPLWAVTLFTLDILVIYGLIAHGRKGT